MTSDIRAPPVRSPTLSKLNVDIDARVYAQLRARARLNNATGGSIARYVELLLADHVGFPIEELRERPRGGARPNSGRKSTRTPMPSITITTNENTKAEVGAK